VQRLRRAMDEAGGAVDFSEFMQRVLYEPGLGYYVAGHRKFGATGDFITAPEMGELFGRCLARQCAEILNELSSGDILEFGAGTGVLCAQLLAALEEEDALPGNYYILEVSPDLRQRQRQTIAERVPGLLARCRWLDRLPVDFEGVVIANEVLDAMPVERFRVTRTGVEVVQVTWSGDSFVESTRPPAAGELLQIAKKDLAPGYESEVGVLARHWVAGIADWLRRGVALIIDYGFPGHEYYHPQRSEGTLMCHHRHRAHPDPYRHIGMQDITAHVDFSALAEAAVEAGLDVLGFTHQAAFLLSLGLTDIAAKRMEASPRDRLALSQEVQRLAQTYEMGELFKVLALGRHYRAPLAGFQYLDHRRRL
jgi:SAM-dependent MidA family methyltransferase